MNLNEFLKQEKQDNNLFWRLSSGEHQSLLDEALEKIEELEKQRAESVQLDTHVSHEPVMFNSAVEILGWQGGTIHQVLEVLRLAKIVANQYHESNISGDWEQMQPTLQSLRNVISG